MIEASVWFSCWILTPSLASTAWCSPSDQRRPTMRRPVNSSTITTSSSCTTYCWSRKNSVWARNATIMWCIRAMWRGS
ncbi:Uncharacterised protein [Bordetella pertussis]|nr:Uncharacterised protein [Bordetella pertussis]